MLYAERYLADAVAYSRGEIERVEYIVVVPRERDDARRALTP